MRSQEFRAVHTHFSKTLAKEIRLAAGTTGHMRLPSRENNDRAIRRGSPLSIVERVKRKEIRKNKADKPKCIAMVVKERRNPSKVHKKTKESIHRRGSGSEEYTQRIPLHLEEGMPRLCFSLVLTRW